MKDFFSSDPKLMSFKWILFTSSSSPFCSAGVWLVAWANSAIYGSFPFADKPNIIYTHWPLRMFEAIWKIQRKRSYSSEPLLTEGEKSPTVIEKMSYPFPGSTDNSRMTMWPYPWPPLLSSLAVYSCASLKCVTWSTCMQAHPARCWSLNLLFEGEK